MGWQIHHSSTFIEQHQVMHVQSNCVIHTTSQMLWRIVYLAETE